MKDGFMHSILISIRQRIEEERERKRKEAERLEYEKVCHFCDGISQEEFDEIVHSVTRRIKRIKKCWTDGSLVICNVYSQSHISVWQFWIEFNDHGRLSGDWTHWHRENTQSDMVESVADQISEAIKTRYQEIRDQQDQR